MRRLLFGLAVVALCVLLPGAATAQKVPGVAGASICDGDPNNIVSNCGFETGTFAPWVQSGDTSFTGIDPGSRHSGIFGLDTGPVNSLGFITQQVPTDPTAIYDLSFWLRNAQVPNRFQVSWNGDVIYDQTNMPNFPYTSSDSLPVGNTSVFIGLVPSDGDTTELKFGFYNVPDFFWFDDVDLLAESVSKR
jgi:hypothetical protein